MERFLPAGKNCTHTGATYYAHTHARPYTRTRNCNRKLFLHIIVVVFSVKLATPQTAHTHAQSPKCQVGSKKTNFHQLFFRAANLVPSNAHTHTQKRRKSGWATKKR